VDNFDFTYISFGAGVQSTALLAMSALGLKGCPKADVAVFADTQDEPRWVYDHLEKMKLWAKTHNLDVKTCTAGKLSEHATDLTRSRWANIPLWTMGENGKEAPLMRQCTRDYKVVPIEKEVRKLLGFKKGERIAGKKMVQCLLGISIDEIIRMKPSRTPWITNSFPLIDARMRREDCLSLSSELGLPVAKKSSCVFCPYHDNATWEDMRVNHPEEFAKAVEFDKKIRDMTKRGVKQATFIHRSLQPLDQVDFIDKNQLRLWGDDAFGNECEGMCGV